jgi:uncharacterized protein (DUF169 family)
MGYDEVNMTVIEKNARDCAVIEKLLRLTHPPVALKLVRHGDEVPADAYMPYEAEGKHLALCQAFALSRRNGVTVYMRREDHWCWNPLIAFGHVKCESPADPGFDIICKTIGIKDAETAVKFVASFVKLPYGEHEGILTAPLCSADFTPDLWLIYCGNGQLRTILRAVKTQTGSLLKSEFDALDSCMYSVIPPVLEGEYRITLPDPGEYERALTDVSNIIFSVPAAKFQEFLAGAEQLSGMGLGEGSLRMEMKDDFARPPFYNALFEIWGLH